MSTASATILLCVAVVSCGGSRSVIIERRDARRSEIAARYDRLIVHSTNQWNQLEADVQGLLSKMVAIAPNGAPMQRVENSAEMLAAAARCQAMSPPDGGISPPADPWDDNGGPTQVERCQSEWSELYVAALQRAYPQADMDAVSKTYDDDGRTEDIEALVVASHNAAIVAIVAAKKSQVAKQKHAYPDSSHNAPCTYRPRIAISG